MATKRGIDFTLTQDEYSVKIAKPCYYCKNLLHKKTESNIGLDRLDSNIGYTNDNTVSCCFVCNTIKGDFLSVEETLAAVKSVIRLRTKKKR